MNFKFFINEEKGEVIAKMVSPLNDLKEEYNIFFSKRGIGFDDKAFKLFEKEFGKQLNNICAKSKCNLEKGDVFSETTGKYLAKERCLRTFERYRQLMYLMIREDLFSLSCEVDKRLMNSIARESEREDRINSFWEE